MNPQQIVRRSASGIAPAFVLAAWCTGAVAQHTERVSVSSSGGEGDSNTWGFSALSGDGRFVVFPSVSDNLVSGDTNGWDDIFVHNRMTGVTERVSVDSSGAEGDGPSWGIVDITPDGRYVVFSSQADNLVNSDNNGCVDVFLRDRQAGTTERISVGAGILEANAVSSGPSISADGRYVAFTSYADNLVPNDTNHAGDVFLRDRVNGTNTRVSLTYQKTQANNSSDWARISADGMQVAFESWADNLVPNDNNNQGDIFVRDWYHGTIQRVSVDSSGAEGNWASTYPAMSGDGRFVVFASWADDLVAGDTNNRQDIFLRDIVNGTTERISVDSAGAEANLNSWLAGVSDDGRFVEFTSDASNLVANDTNGANDVFRRDRTAGTTVRENVSTTGVQGDGWVDVLSISRDGRFASFDDIADNLVANDTNGQGDVFVHGPWLTLEADPPLCAAGATLTFDTFTGNPGGPTLLVCSGVNGAATFIPLVFGTFDGTGVWSLSATVPSGLAGNVVTFETLGIAPNGKVAFSNPADVSFQ